MIRLILTCCVLLLGSLSVCGQSVLASSVQDNYLAHLLNRNSLLFDIITPTENKAMVDVDSEWRSWKTVENFTFGKDRGGLPMIADLNSLHPYFRDKIVELINVCRRQGIELEVVESFRTRAKQSEYFAMGKKYTRSSGGKSRHQFGLAVDVVAIVDGVPQWDNQQLWRKIGVAGEKLGLRWGGRWRTPYDPAHFEYFGATSYQVTYGVQPLLPKAKAALYPCIDEHIQRLQRAYSAWEIEQASATASASRKRKRATGSVGQ